MKRSVIILALLLSGCAGMTAAEKREMRGAWIRVGHAAACAAAMLACERYGGEDCAAWTKLGCTVGGSVVNILAAKTTPPTETEVRGTVTRAMTGLPVPPKKKPPGFRTPTRDSEPLKVQ